MAYLGKLSPTVGNGLGGMPEGKVSTPKRGEIIFSTPGTHTWTVPKGVTSLSMVAIAGGGSAFGEAFYRIYGGGGGALAWVNSVSVSAGDTLQVTVGGSGRCIRRVTIQGSGGRTFSGSAGGDSLVKINGTTVVHAEGGKSGSGTSTTIAVGGNVIVGNGGNGGNGGNTPASPLDVAIGVGGGGAGGYSGNGGNGGNSNVAGTNGIGGAGAGGFVVLERASTGGGVFPFGEGTSGVSQGTTYSTTHNGSVPSNITISALTVDCYGVITNNNGPYYGAGASIAMMRMTNNSCYIASSEAGAGVVRIIWGEGRAFPSTDCGQD